MDSPKAKPTFSGIAATRPQSVMGIAILKSIMASPIMNHEPLPVRNSTMESTRLTAAVSTAPSLSAMIPPKALPRQLAAAGKGTRPELHRIRQIGRL